VSVQAVPLRPGCPAAPPSRCAPAGHNPRRGGGAKPAFLWKSDATTGPGEHFRGKGRPTGVGESLETALPEYEIGAGTGPCVPEPKPRSVSVQAVPLRPRCVRPLFLAAAGSAGHKPRRGGGAKPAFLWKGDATAGPGEHFGGKGRPAGAGDRSKRHCRSMKLVPGRSRMSQNRNLDRCQFRLSRCARPLRSPQAVPLRPPISQAAVWIQLPLCFHRWVCKVYNSGFFPWQIPIMDVPVYSRFSRLPLPAHAPVMRKLKHAPP